MYGFICPCCRRKASNLSAVNGLTKEVTLRIIYENHLSCLQIEEKFLNFSYGVILLIPV